MRQGDPCGPLFFALTVQPTLERLQKDHTAVRIIAYLDDIVMQGPAFDVNHVKSRLREDLAQVGLGV